MKDQVAKWITFVGEVLMLPMLYRATLLAPIPFGILRISIILLLAAVSFRFAYLSGSRFRDHGATEPLAFKQVLAKPPVVVWITVVAAIGLQLASGLIMTYMATRK